MRLKLVYIYSFVVTLLYLLTACTDGIEASSDSNGQGEGKEIPKQDYGNKTNYYQRRPVASDVFRRPSTGNQDRFSR